MTGSSDVTRLGPVSHECADVDRFAVRRESDPFGDDPTQGA